MKVPLVAVLASAVTALSLAPALHADVLTENFDELSAMPSVTSAGAFSTINGTNVDVVGGLNGSFFSYLCTGPESGNCIDLGGSGGNPIGQLASNASFAAGTYELSFDLIGSQRSQTTSTTVTFGDYSQTFVLDPFDTTSGVVVDQLVTLTSPGQLLFINDGTNPYHEEGALLDNVSIAAAPSSVTPEPESLVLLSTGTLGLAGILRRKMLSTR